MHGFGNHSFRWINAEGKAFYVKWHFITEAGIKNFTDDEAVEMKKKDPDFAGRDLFEHIDKGSEASWKFMVQIMPKEEAANYKWNILDVTKVWPHGDYPLQPVGRLVLNRTPENFFQEIEQAAFAAGHFVPGIEASFDKMLQGRLFSYPDTHRHRLGPNSRQIPVNCPFRSRVHNGSRDGLMTVDGNQGSKPNYEPNSHKIFEFSKEAAVTPLPVQKSNIGKRSNRKIQAQPSQR